MWALATVSAMFGICEGVFCVTHSRWEEFSFVAVGTIALVVFFVALAQTLGKDERDEHHRKA
jgi:hypothetical protein